MSVVIRGAKNAFRNSVRTLSVTLILAISIGLAIVMLLASSTVKNRIESVKTSMGNTVNISPAGAMGFEGGGEPLTETQMANIYDIAHISSISSILTARMTSETDTSLVSGIEAGTLGGRQMQRNQRDFGGSSSENSSFGSENSQKAMPSPPADMKMPIMATGISNTSTITDNSSYSLTEGTLFDANSSENIAIIGSEIATKNSLTKDSTFTAFGQTIKVVGVYTTGNKFTDNGVYFPINTLQTLNSTADEISSATIKVDSVDNLTTVSDEISKVLGDVADVTNTADSVKDAVTPLENIQRISIYSLIGSLVAGAIITLLTMMMIVRERRREIGVLKAIGSSNIGIVTQFVTESMVLTLLGSIVGMVLGTLLSNPILNALVNNNSSTVTSAIPKPGSGFGRVIMSGGANIQNAMTNLQTSVGLDVIGYGFLAAILIAILGSAIPAYLIAKVKPAEVMRGE